MNAKPVWPQDGDEEAACSHSEAIWRAEEIPKFHEHCERLLGERKSHKNTPDSAEAIVFT